MKLYILYSLFLPLAFLFTSCSGSPTAANNSGNLISNPNFSSGGNPSLAGWVVNDTSIVKVVANAPGRTNAWSIWLAPPGGAFTGGEAKTYVTGLSGNAVYTIQGWERNFSRAYWGNVVLTHLRNGSVVSYRAFQVMDTSWASFEFSDSLNLVPTDTLELTLGGWSLLYNRAAKVASLDTASTGVCFNQLSLTK